MKVAWRLLRLPENKITRGAKVLGMKDNKLLRSFSAMAHNYCCYPGWEEGARFRRGNIATRLAAIFLRQIFNYLSEHLVLDGSCLIN